MKANEPRSAFTIVELMIAGAVACFVGLIVFGVASEALVAFERNFSINRSYSDARRTLDRISVAMQSAGHTPVLIDATGADSPPTRPPRPPGVRFWHYSSSPLYYDCHLTCLTLTSYHHDGQPRPSRARAAAPPCNCPRPPSAT